MKQPIRPPLSLRVGDRAPASAILCTELGKRLPDVEDLQVSIDHRARTIELQGRRGEEAVGASVTFDPAETTCADAVEALCKALESRGKVPDDGGFCSW